MILGPHRGSADIILSLGATRRQQVQRVDLCEDSTGYRVLTFYNPDVWRHISMLWEHLSPPRPSGYIWSKETTPRCFKFPQTCASGSQRADSTTSCTEEAPEIHHLLRATSRSATLMVCVHHITALLILLTSVCRNDTAHLTASGLVSSQRAQAHLNLQQVCRAHGDHGAELRPHDDRQRNIRGSPPTASVCLTSNACCKNIRVRLHTDESASSSDHKRYGDQTLLSTCSQSSEPLRVNKPRQRAAVFLQLCITYEHVYERIHVCRSCMPAEH